MLMRKIVFCMSMLIAFIASGQNDVKQWSLKPFAGMSVSSFMGADADGSEARFGYHGGLEAEYQLHHRWSVALGALYSTGGAKISENAEKMTIKSDRIYFPLTAKCYVWRGLSLSTGVAPTIVVNSVFDFRGAGVSVGVKSSKISRSFDVSIPIGVSYEYRNVVVGASAYFGLCPLFKKNSYIEANGIRLDLGDAKINNYAAMISLGYKFKLK